MTGPDLLASARAFLDREARLIERRLAAVRFDGASPRGVVDAVRAYRNDDGGFGHGLEPDKRCPASLPIDVEIALDILVAAGAGSEARDLIRGACDWLATVATPDGGVASAFPVIEGYPRAEHWSDWAYQPGINPTAGLVGRLYALGVTDHPWLDQATEWVWAKLASGWDDDAHALGEAMLFLEHVPDRDRAGAVSAQVGAWIDGLKWFRADPDDPGYGLTPLHFAPSPRSPWRSLFDDAAIEGHLDRMQRDQQPDGGWPITWEPPSAASALEWRGIETLRALRVLSAYGRIEPVGHG